MIKSVIQTTPIHQNAAEAIIGAAQKVLVLPAINSNFSAD
jgi:hypothetical protein